MKKLINSLTEQLTEGEKKKLRCDKLHFNDYRANLYFGLSTIAKMAFNAGNGHEFKSRREGLPSKASALHSSSMLACNFFDWINICNSAGYEICVEGHKYNKAYFEVKIPTLAKPKPTYANMDVMLVSSDSRKIAFIESKFTEHLSCAASELCGRFVTAYEDINRYYDGCCAEQWRAIVEKWKKYAKTRMIDGKEIKGYYNGIKQDICHLIAIGNLQLSHEARKKFVDINRKTFGTFDITDIKDFDFINLVYEPNTEHFKKEREYCKSFEILCRKLFSDVPKEIRIRKKFYTYSMLWNDNFSMLGNVRNTSSAETLENFLSRRYMNMKFSSVGENV